MPESNFTITQGTMSITEFGNSVPYTGKLDDLSEHPVKEVINKVLKNDAMKAFDIAAHAEFNKTPLRVVRDLRHRTDVGRSDDQRHGDRPPTTSRWARITSRRSSI